MKRLHKEIHIEIITRCINNNLGKIYTHHGFINNADLTFGERELLDELVKDMKDREYVINMGDINDEQYCATIYHSSYNGGIALAGLKIVKLIK